MTSPPLYGKFTLATQEYLGRGLKSAKLLGLMGLMMTVIALLFAIMISVWTEELNLVDIMLMGVLVTSAIATAYMFMVADEVQIFRAHNTLAYLACIVLLGLVANAIFGERATQVSIHSMPYILVYVSIIVLFLFSCQPPRRAWVFTAALTTVGGALVVLNISTQDATGVHSTLFWILVCCTLLPLHTALMCHININNRLEVAKAEIDLQVRHEEEARNQALDSVTDLATAGLNRKGVMEQLRAALTAHEDVQLVLVDFPDHYQWRERRPYHEVVTDLKRLAGHIACMPAVGRCWGRLQDAKFAIWSTSADAHERIREGLASLGEEFVLPTTVHHGLVTRAELAHVELQEVSGLMLQEADHRLFMRSLN